MRATLAFVARYLHIVAIALTNLGFGLTVVGCSSAAVRVVPLHTTSFQHMRDVDIASRGRWPAHGMRKWVRGESSDKVGVMDSNMLPEPYIDDNAVLGQWPSQFHVAYAAVVILREHYAATHPAYQVPDDVRLVAAVEAADGRPHEVLEFEKERELDIVDVHTRQLFEVVPRGPNHLAGGNNKVDWILQVLNKSMGGASEFTLGTGYAGAVGVRFSEAGRPWRLSWQTKAPGVIAYHWHVLGALNDKGENEDEDDEEAYRANHWHEPTTFEMTSFGRALHETVERLAYAREQLGPLRVATEMPILLSNTAPDYRRSVALWGASGDAQLLPIVRADAPEVVSVPQSVAKRLASCTSQSAGRVKPAQHAMSFNVYVTNKGWAVSAQVAQSTLGDRDIEACLVGVLRGTLWPAGVSAAPPASKLFVADGPSNLPNVQDLLKEILRNSTPPGARGGFKPYYVLLPLGPLIVGVTVGVTVFIFPRDTAPRCATEMNPITRQPYTSVDECEQVLRLSPDEIVKQQLARIKATQPQAPPVPQPQPQPQPQPAQPNCPRNEHFVPERTDDARGCTDKKGNLQCYSSRHFPCEGVHTRGRWRYQKMRGSRCIEVEEKAVRCEGPFEITGRCGSASTTMCGDEGTATSGIFVKSTRVQ